MIAKMPPKSEGAGIRIGISGWRFAPWRGTIYPKGLRQIDELQAAGYCRFVRRR